MAKLTHRARYPRPQHLLKAIDTITRSIPLDHGRSPELTWRTSEAGVPNLRVNGVTNRIPWYVDLYSGHFYRVVAAQEMGEVWHTLPALVQYLRRQLCLGPLPRHPEGE